MAAPAPAKGGNVLTRKIGPLPGWAWAAVAVGGYYLWKKRQAAAAASSAATPTTSTATPTPVAAAPSGYGYQGPGTGGGNYGYQVPTGATAATASSYTAPTGQTIQAGGYGPQSGQGTVTDAQGNVYQYISSPQILGSLQQSGQQIYYETAPGVFAPQSGNLAPGTPAFQMVSGAGQPTYTGSG
jgi:hypothetical protein